MMNSGDIRFQVLVIILLSLFSLAAPAVLAAENTMPSQYKDDVKPELAAKYSYTEDGEFGQALGLPTYEWMPRDKEPDAIVIGIHGLTLHGRSYRVLARLLACYDIGFISLDMRGFGRCKFDDEKKFSTVKDDKAKVDHEKSYQEIVELAKLIRAKYPKKDIIVLGESLGCTFCVRIAAEHHDLVDGMVLSAPAVTINEKMYGSASAITAGTKAFFGSGNMDLHSFINTLVSDRPEISKEMLDDPMILKKIPLTALLSTDSFVGKTAKWGKTVDQHLPVLILQGSNDSCVAAKNVTELMDNMPSDDQTLAWRGRYGHLQLETSFMRVAILNALIDWFQDHDIKNKAEAASIEANIAGLGGTLSN